MEALDLLRLSFRFLHLIGMGIVVGSTAIQLLTRQYRVNSWMGVGGMLAVVTGLILAAPWPRDDQPDPAKLITKVLLVIAIVVISTWAEKKDIESKPMLYGIAGLILLTVGVAVFWT